MFNLRTFKLPMPELPVFTMKADYSHHVINSAPGVMAHKAWAQTAAALNAAALNVEQELRHDQKAKAIK